MKHSDLQRQLLVRIRELIDRSCGPHRNLPESKALHSLLVRKSFNAADVQFDYERGRVRMHLVLDEKLYTEGTPNIGLPTLYTNLLYGNLREFLYGCVEQDPGSLAFYAGLLREGVSSEVPLQVA